MAATSSFRKVLHAQCPAGQNGPLKKGHDFEYTVLSCTLQHPTACEEQSQSWLRYPPTVKSATTFPGITRGQATYLFNSTIPWGHFTLLPQVCLWVHHRRPKPQKYKAQPRRNRSFSCSGFFLNKHLWGTRYLSGIIRMLFNPQTMLCSGYRF